MRYALRGSVHLKIGAGSDALEIRPPIQISLERLSNPTRHRLPLTHIKVFFLLIFSQGVLSMDKGDIVLKEMKEPPESPGLKFY